MNPGRFTTTELAIDGRADPPEPPSNLAAQGAIRQTIVTWTTPTGRHYRTTEIWASSSATFSAGGKVGESDRGQFVHTGLLPNTTRWYWLRAADAFGQFSAWVGPVLATTSLLVADDLTNGIISTAQFAAGIKPLALPATAGDLATLRTAEQIIYPQADITDSSTGQALSAGRLYRWTDSAWVAVVSATELAGQITSTQISSNAISSDKIAANAITAGKIAAGAISSTEIAAGAIRATNLASETLITQAGQLGSAVIGTAQIQDLSVGTLKVANNAISETVAATWGGGYLDYYNWSTLAQISFNAEAGDRFQVMAQWRCYGESGYADSGGEGGPQRYDFYWLVRVLVDGGEWYVARGNYEAWPSYINVIAFGAGWHSITLQGIEQSGEVYSAYVSATRLKR